MVIFPPIEYDAKKWELPFFGGLPLSRIRNYFRCQSDIIPTSTLFIHFRFHIQPFFSHQILFSNVITD